MNRTIIISLVGEQTIPNVSFIKALPGATEYWFIETEKTKREKRADSVMEACGISNAKAKFALVQPEALTFEPPPDWVTGTDDRCYINLTGGTKMMTLSVYRYYQNKENAKLYYSPIGDRKSMPLNHTDLPLELPSLTMQTYLLAQGYLLLDPVTVLRRFAYTTSLFKKVLQLGKPGNVPEIYMALSASYRKKDKNYFTGIWFEDYIYGAIKRELKLTDDEIVRGLKLQHIVSKAKSESDQEVDVAFLYKGTLYLVECKVYLYKATIQKYSDPVYKLGAINRTFDLGAKAIVCVLGPENVPAGTSERIGYLCGVTNVHSFLTLEDFRSGKTLKQLFKIK